MIGSIKGKIIRQFVDKKEKFLIVETAGVGYKIWVSPEVLSKTKNNENCFLYIHTHVREDALDLYGFLDYEELEFFEMLINVSGIGPKGALTILGIASIQTMQKAINTNDIAYLTKNIWYWQKNSRKNNHRIKRQGREKDIGGSLKDELDALEALKSLGYSQGEARESIEKVPQELDTNSKIRIALKNLGK